MLGGQKGLDTSSSVGVRHPLRRVREIGAGLDRSTDPKKEVASGEECLACNLLIFVILGGQRDRPAEASKRRRHVVEQRAGMTMHEMMYRDFGLEIHQNTERRLGDFGSPGF